MKDSLKFIKHNKVVHDKIAPFYDSRHVEIFNPEEQKRIKSVLIRAVSEIKTESPQPIVLDFGAGTGNLTYHLMDLNVRVVAADISENSLQQLISKVSKKDGLSIKILHGEDLSQFNDNSFDMVATYSVLHHISNYLKIVEEFVRVVKPGGVIYIDHEVCPSYWEHNVLYQAYLSELGYQFAQAHLKELGLIHHQMKKTEDIVKIIVNSFYKALKTFSLKAIMIKINNLLRSKSQPKDEGDIHVHKNDHIEWEKIKKALSPSHEIVDEVDYLVCREPNSAKVWQKWHDKCVDMRMIIARIND